MKYWGDGGGGGGGGRGEGGRGGGGEGEGGGEGGEGVASYLLLYRPCYKPILIVWIYVHRCSLQLLEPM